MAKTSIDGLTVRSSSSRRAVGHVAMSQSGKVVDFARKPAKQTSLRNRDRSTTMNRVETSRTTVKRKRSSLVQDDFLSPVGGLSFDTVGAGTGSTFGKEADWSDLLNEFTTDGSKERQSFDLERDSLLFDDEDIESDKPKKKKRKKHKLKIGRIIFATILLLLVGGGVALYLWGDGLISKLTGGNSGFWDTLHALVSEEIPFETDTKGRTNVLVFGTEGYDMNGSSYDGVHDGAQLTDSIMVISFDQETKDVALLSIPRDLKVSMACSAGKINEVFWCHNQDGNNEEAGANALMRQLEQVLGIEFQYWAHVNWGSLVDIVNTLGGVTVTLDEDINDYGWTNVVAYAGVPIEINGEQALGLARARHGTMGGDFTRGNTQQKIVEGIIQKVIDNGIGLNEALGLLGILGDNLRTNFSSDNIKAGVKMIAGFDTSSMRNVQLADYQNNVYYVTTATINDISYVVPYAGTNDFSEIQDFISRMFSSDSIGREGAQIVVYNATGLVGQASAEQSRLEEAGFTVTNIDNTAEGNCLEKYCVFMLNEEKTATAEALRERYGKDTLLGVKDLPQDVWPGWADFVVIIGEPVMNTE